MFLKKKSIIFALLLFLLSDLNSLSILPHKEDISWAVGPEAYHIKRKREGGSHQRGFLYGIASLVEKRSPGIYYLLDGYITYGEIEGKTAKKQTIKSEIVDYEIQPALGYKIRRRSWEAIAYGGYSLLHSKNRFIKPSPNRYTFRTKVQSAFLALALSVKLKDNLSAGVDFRAKHAFDSRNKVSGNRQVVANKPQYELQLPISWQAKCGSCRFHLSARPFYRFRHFGGHENYPYYFFDTKFHIYGARFVAEASF